jgi:1-aminocyclopropane-1-carboxylate deaminase/D-cysteine desulfhydrase-like pyridoxal-dependent ACC family enzyme
MHLHFISRQHYREKTSPVFLEQLQQHYPEHYLIPEGGTNILAIQGCKEILTAEDRHNYDVICCAVGTGGTMTGLIEASSNHQHILGFSALKGDFLKSDVQQWTSKQNWQISDAYCCSGYAKTSPELLQFMQSFENQHHLRLEQVYTAKMMYGLMDLIGQNHFPAGSRILVIHTGGLQGRHRDADLS